LADPTRLPPDGAEIVAFFDGSYNGDSSGLVGCTLPQLKGWRAALERLVETIAAGEDPLPLGPAPHLFVIDAWERPQGWKGKTWLVPRHEVNAAVHAMMGRWKVRRLGGDPPGWHDEFDRWAEAYGDEVVVLWETNQRKRMSQACSRFYAAVVHGGLTQDGDPRLARHLRNAVVKETSEGAYITKDGRASPRKIDLAVAAVGALEMAATLENDGPIVLEGSLMA